MKKYQPQLILIIRMILGLIFIYASIRKIVDPQEFARSIENYRMIPFGLENTMAIILPWVELLAGISLVTGFMLDGGAILTGAMSVMFILAISQAILRGYNIECGCGLNPGQLVGVGKIIEDTIYLIWAWMIFSRKEKWLELSLKSV